MTPNRKRASVAPIRQSGRGLKVRVAGSAVFALAVFVCLAIISSAEGHRSGSFYPIKYPPPRDRVSFYFDQAFPRGQFRDRVVRASRQWNKLDGRFSFRAHRSSIDDERKRVPSKCTRERINENFDSVIYWRVMDGRTRRVGGGDLRNNLLARAGVCSEVGGLAQWFYMTFDRQERWYAGRGDPPGTTADAQSVATHELGHATGWSGHYDDKDAKPTLCPDPANNSQHTMCRDYQFGSAWQRGLEPHDRHTFERSYGGQGSSDPGPPDPGPSDPGPPDTSS